MNKDQELRRKEIEDIKAFAKANGFALEIEDEDKKKRRFELTKEFLDK
jgi:hypothetical protein